MIISAMVVGLATLVGASLIWSREDALADPPPDDDHADSGPPEELDDDALRHDNDDNLLLTSGALALQTAGLVIPVVGSIAVAPLAIVGASVVHESYLRFRAGAKPWTGLADAVFICGSLATGHLFAAALMGVLVTGSKKLVERTRRQTRDGLGRIFGELPTRAWVYIDGVEVEVGIAEIQRGDCVVVCAGNPIPVDGVVVDGVGMVDEVALTGEPTPVVKAVGDEVFAATFAVEGPLMIRATKTGDETTVGELHRILARTEEFTARYASRAERLVEKGAGPTLAFSALTVPLLGVTSAVAVSSVGFGYQMRMAGPLSAVTFINLAARQGVLIKDARALELLSAVDVAVFDKTGTLTSGEPTVIALRPVATSSEAELLQIAAAAERGQAHPIARAILTAAARAGVGSVAAERVEVELGAGLRAFVDGAEVRVGSAQLLARDGIDVASEPASAPGVMTVYVARRGQLVGAIDLAATVRPEAHAVVNALRSRGVDIVLLSGDRRAAAEMLACELGIDEVHAEVKPEEKAALISALQARGRRVCFVGDGINDAIALRAADVSISLSGASMVATDAASVIMLSGDLGGLPELFDLAVEFRVNIERGVKMSVVPGILCVSAVYVLGLNITACVLLYNTSLAVAVGNALVPRLRVRRDAATDAGAPANRVEVALSGA